ncbi:hypothetical protein niasHT_001384 [Heterodera trifolii]|uniref:Uncharacterized protein n=1 Tax=Heterodera trifolii TaxID=157864 RepID=A0ABD2LP25_9BILA
MDKQPNVKGNEMKANGNDGFEDFKLQTWHNELNGPRVDESSVASTSANTNTAPQPEEMPLSQQPSTSNGVGEESLPSCSTIGIGKNGKAFRIWDNRCRPVGIVGPSFSDSHRRPTPYFRPRQLQPVPQQPQQQQHNQQQQSPALPFPLDSLPPIQVPQEIRREFLRRMSQETDHFFGLGQLVAEWNPTLAGLFLSLEVFCRAILQSCVAEGSGHSHNQHPFGRRPECRRR